MHNCHIRLELAKKEKYTISSVLNFACCASRFQAYHWRRQSMPFKPHKNRTTWNNCSPLRESCYRVWINPLFQNTNFGMKNKSCWRDPKFQIFVPCDCSASSAADINAGLQDGVERTFFFFLIDINMKRMKMIGLTTVTTTQISFSTCMYKIIGIINLFKMDFHIFSRKTFPTLTWRVQLNIVHTHTHVYNYIMVSRSRDCIHTC